MRNTARALALALALLPVAASAQQFQTVPDHSVIGRIGIGGSSGPSQAIPFSLFNQSILGSLCQSNNAFPVYSVASAAWVCSSAQAANVVYAGPTSSTAQPTFRALVGADLPLPAASTLGGVFSKAAVGSNWLRSLGTDGNLTASQPAFTDISGVATGAQLPNPSASTLGGVQSKVVVSHQFLNTISTAGVPGSAQPACADVSDATVYCNATRGQIPGVTSNTAATAGNVGEIIPSTVLSGSAVTLTTATNANVTSISVTAGEWDITGSGSFTGGATTTLTFCQSSISLTTATIDTTPERLSSMFYNNAVVFNSINPAQPTGPTRFSFSGTTTVFLVARCNFGTSTAAAFGTIRATRVH